MAQAPVSHKILEQGEYIAEEGHLVTFGIVPTGPETGYGYIKGSAELGDNSNAMQIERFVEKPDKETAEGSNAGESSVDIKKRN